MRYVYIFRLGDKIEVFGDTRSLPSNVTSTDVRRARQAAGEMVTFRGDIKLGYMPVKTK